VSLGAATLTAGADNTSTTFAGAIVGAGGINRKGTLGTLTLSGANTYTGATTVTAGVLQAGVSTNAFGANSAVSLANAASAVLDLNGFDNTVGSLSGGGLREGT